MCGNVSWESDETWSFLLSWVWTAEKYLIRLMKREDRCKQAGVLQLLNTDYLQDMHPSTVAFPSALFLGLYIYCIFLILNVLICNEASPKKATHTHCNTQRGNRGHISLFSCIIIIKPSSHLYFRWMGACVTKNFLTQLGMLMWGCVKPSKLGPQVFSLSLAKASKVPLERKDQKNSTKWRFEG